MLRVEQTSFSLGHHISHALVSTAKRFSQQQQRNGLMKSATRKRLYAKEQALLQQIEALEHELPRLNGKLCMSS